MCAKKVAKKFRPLPGFARHFAFSETGQAVRPLRFLLCIKRRKFRFLFRMKASHFLVRQESGKEAPGPSVPLKNTNSNANNWRICVFLTRHSDGPGTPTANEVAFSVARETARMTFVCSHPTDASKNDIGNRAGRDGVSGPHTGQHFAPRACGKAAAQK